MLGTRLSRPVVLITALATLFLLAPSQSLAATFTVTSTAPTYDGVCDADCTLIDAILEAEANAEADEIHLQEAAVYTMTDDYYLQTATPAILTAIVIYGHGATVERDSAAPNFRLFWVQPSGDLTLRDLTVRGGKVKNTFAGGIYNRYGRLTLRNCIVEENTTIKPDGGNAGGGIHNRFGSMTIDDTTVRNNSATQGGGIASQGEPGVTVTIRNSAIVNNQALSPSTYGGIGGGLMVWSEHVLTIEDTTVSGNTADKRGAGIYLHSVPIGFPVNFKNITVTGNEAFGTDTGGIRFQICGASCPVPTEPFIENSIVADNVAASGPQDWLGDYVSGGYNIIGDGSGTFGPTTGDQVVTSLGSLSALETTGAAGGEHHRPLTGSIAIGAGNDATCNAVDQLHFGRVGTCETGAIEYRTCAAVPADLVNWWPLDDISGTDAIDITGVPNDGTRLNDPTPLPGMVEHALCFDGVDDHVSVPDDDELDVLGDCTGGSNEDFTFDAWIKTASSGEQVIVDKRDSNGGFLQGYTFYVIDGRLALRLSSGIGTPDCGTAGSACEEYVSPVPGGSIPDLRDDRWHFVAVAVETCAGGSGRLYIDGDLVQTFTPLVGPLFSSANLLIGRSYPIPTTDLHFRGCIDELEMFKRALSESELDAIHDSGWEGKCKSTCGPSVYPECHGSCEPAGVCVPSGGTCVCQIPACGDANSPECLGGCPAGQTCVDGFGGCICEAEANPAVPCSQSLFGVCDGFCLAGQVCTSVEGSQSCECLKVTPACSGATLPACEGYCPSDSQCVANAGPGPDCICEACIADPPIATFELAFLGKDDYGVNELDCATSYNSYRSDTAGFADANRDGLADDYGTCDQNGLVSPEFSAAGTPQPGRMYGYLVTGVNTVGEGTLGLASNDLERPNDAPCP